MSKWDKFSGQDSSSSKGSASKQASIFDKPVRQGTKSTAGLKDKVVKDVVGLRDKVTNVIKNAGSQMPASRVQDLEDAQGTLDGTVQAIAPEYALANQQKSEQQASIGMGMGGNNSGDDETEQE